MRDVCDETPSRESRRAWLALTESGGTRPDGPCRRCLQYYSKVLTSDDFSTVQCTNEAVRDGSYGFTQHITVCTSVPDRTHSTLKVSSYHRTIHVQCEYTVYVGRSVGAATPPAPRRARRPRAYPPGARAISHFAHTAFVCYTKPSLFMAPFE